ncbi:hypothetical protein DFH06DRAFT_1327000 [Mycena polygramma]|nr:hypothetical protein DFH06DRAFT_1327000 [Mycena polygramma]
MASVSLSSTAGPSAPLDILSDIHSPPHPSNGTSPQTTSNASPVTAKLITKTMPQAIGLGILVCCPDTNSLTILSPLAMRRASPTLAVPRAQAPLCRRVKQGAGPLMARTHAALPPQCPAPRRVSIAPTPAKYAGLGHGLPKHLHATRNNRGYRRPAAHSAIIRISSVPQCRSSISQLLGIVSHSRAVLHAMHVSSTSPRVGSPTQLVESHKAGRSSLNRICAAVAQLVTRKQPDGKRRLGGLF